MRKLFAAVILLCASVCAWGQGATVLFPPAVTQQGNFLPFAKITFCTTPATLDTLGNCTNTVTVYKDQALTQPYSSAIQTDGIGYFPPNANTATSIWFTPAANLCYTLTTSSMLSPATNPCTPFSVGAQLSSGNLLLNGNLTQTQTTAATNVANQNSFSDCMNATYWTGAVSATDSWCLQDILGAGANPTSTFTLTHSGSGGVALLSLPTLAPITTTKINQTITVQSTDTGADMGAKIQNKITTCPTTGTNQGCLIDATSFTGDQAWASTLTLGTANQTIVLNLGIVRIISSAAPVIKCPAGVSCNIFGSGNIAGLSSANTGGTQIVNNGAANTALDWSGAQGTVQNLTVVSSAAAPAIFVRATVASGKSAQQNVFLNVGLSGPGTGTAGSIGIQLQSNSATELATENVFTGVSVQGYADLIKMTTTGTQGPTDNWFNGISLLGGGPGGNCINIQSGDINWFTGGIAASCANGVIIGATATQNSFAIRLESNTLNINNAGIGTVFMPANWDANTITDTGTNTVILGAAQVGILQKLGNGGGFQINPPFSIGQPPQTGIAVFVQPIQTLVGGTQVGAQFVPQTSSAATATGIGVRARADTMAAAYAQALNQGLRVDTPSVGAGSSITEWDGLDIEAAPVAGTKCSIKMAGSTSGTTCINTSAVAGGTAAPIISTSFTTTAATTDNVTVTGMTSTGHCGLQATNSGAAGGIASVFVSAKAANQITVTHTATANWTFDVMCSPI